MREVKAEDWPAGTNRTVLCLDVVAGHTLRTPSEGLVPLWFQGWQEMPFGLVFPLLMGRKVISCSRFFGTRGSNINLIVYMQ